MSMIDDMNKELDDLLNRQQSLPIEHHYSHVESFSGRSFVETEKWTNRDNSHNGQHNARTEIEFPSNDAFETKINNGSVILHFGGNSEINTMADCFYQLACFLKENNSSNNGKD